MDIVDLKAKVKAALRRVGLLDVAVRFRDRLNRVKYGDRFGSRTRSFAEMAAGNYFRPTRVSALSTVLRPHKDEVGRLAATVGDQDGESATLAAMLAAENQDLVRKVALVGQTKSLRRQGIEAIALVPGASSEELLSEFSYLVIDGCSIDNSPWAGSLTSSGAKRLAEVEALLTAANRFGLVSVFIDGGTPTHFTDQIRDRSNLIIGRDGLLDPPIDPKTLPVIEALQSYAMASHHV